MSSDMEICDEGTNGGAPPFPASRKRKHVDSSNDARASASFSSLEILERAQSPNFEELARQYPKFRIAWNATRSTQKDRGSASFSSCVTQEFSIELTRALLQALFRLKLPYLDEDHLCPPVPNRFFYLHWIHTKLMGIAWVRKDSNFKPGDFKNTRGLDIGSGASCIYSLLAARFFRSKMITSEIDPKSVGLAMANVAANHLSSMISVIQVPLTESQSPQQQASSMGGPLQCAIATWAHTQPNSNTSSDNNMQQRPPRLLLDFVMTNPPFYDPNSMELSAPRAGDGRARTNMTVSEGNYPGGEIGFVMEIIADSLKSFDGQRIFSSSWYSSMLGKKSSLVYLQKLLVHILGPSHVETIEYGPGQYTRWFLAWTLEQPPANAIGALCPKHEKDNVEVHVKLSSCRNGNPLQEVADRIHGFCGSSPGNWILSATVAEGFSRVFIVEGKPPPPTTFVDEGHTHGFEIPECIRKVVDHQASAKFLPLEGHFLVEAKLGRTVGCVPDEAIVTVRLSCYKHSLRGGKAIEKIRNTLGGEVARTNRKWRKIFQRQQHRPAIG